MRPVPLLVPLAFLFALNVHRHGEAQAPGPSAPARESATAPDPLPVLQDRPDAPAPAPGDGAAAALPLAEPFHSVAVGIAIRPPAGFKTERKLGGEEVSFSDEQRKWTLKLTRMQLNDPMGLEPAVDAKTNLPRAGVLEVRLDQLKAAMPGAAVLRSDVISLGAADAGIIVLRHVEGLETRLSQQALVRGSDRLYFVISLSSPGSRTPEKDGGDDGHEDPAERQAVETFQAVLDTVELLDQRPIRREQDERLYASLAFYVGLNAEGKLEKTLVPRQWFRIVKNDKDIGYLYTVEEIAEGIPGHKRAATAAARARGKAGAAGLAAPETGVLIGMRSRTVPGENLQVDSESWMFCTPDRRNEQWSTLTVVQDRKNKTEDHGMTFGASSRQASRVLDRAALVRGDKGDKDDPEQPPVVIHDDYRLNVTHVSKSETARPISQGLPKIYLPQALGHLLPRVLPLREPKRFMFATYVEEARAVMLRYVDVGAEQRVTLAGEAMRAIPIKDRLGLEGSVTTHYVSSNGKYLGSQNADNGVWVLPSSEQALLKIWKDANLSRPADAKEPEGQAPAAGNAAPPAPGAVAPATGRAPAGATGARAPRDRTRPAVAR
jgi:hypothetical protein